MYYFSRSHFCCKDNCFPTKHKSIHPLGLSSNYIIVIVNVFVSIHFILNRYWWYLARYIIAIFNNVQNSVRP
nr:MAG TPA: hypothetical protein [Caudoviricetes sp.]DAS75365.1 MAG TPA: hypothetical protein [Caudoviricetes sp.]